MITVGSFANIRQDRLEVGSFWRDHRRVRTAVSVTQYQETKPATLTGIEKYLGSGLIKGVGPVTAKRIVMHFGLETLNIESQTERLIEVPGIAKAVDDSGSLVSEGYQGGHGIPPGHGVSTTYAVKSTNSTAN